MIISFQHKFIFVAIPKTAGHSIRRALRPSLKNNDWEQCTLSEEKYFPVQDLADIGHGHITCQQIRPYLLPDIWESFFKFCFVRNPYDRFVSFCCFYNRNNSRMQQDPLGTMKQTMQDRKIHLHILLRPQLEFVSMINDQTQLVVNYYGKYESLQDDYEHICKQIPLNSEHLSLINSSERVPVCEYYDRELQEMVYTFYQQDFAAFGYAFNLDFEQNNV